MTDRAAFSDEVSAVYAEMERDHWWYRGRRRILIRLLERFLGRGRGRRILDIGCGSGYMLPFLRPFGTACGIERDPDLVRLGRKRGLDLQVRDFPRESAEGEYEVVMLLDVIEHLPDDVKALREARRLLVSGGRLVVSVPAFSWMWSAHDEAVGHHRRYNAALLRTRLEQAGFRPAHLTYFNTFLFPLVWAYRVLRRGEGHDFSMPPRPVNDLLARVFQAESALAAGPGLGIGVSLAAVAIRPD